MYSCGYLQYSCLNIIDCPSPNVLKKITFRLSREHVHVWTEWSERKTQQQRITTKATVDPMKMSNILLFLLQWMPNSKYYPLRCGRLSWWLRYMFVLFRARPFSSFSTRSELIVLFHRASASILCVFFLILFSTVHFMFTFCSVYY